MSEEQQETRTQQRSIPTQNFRKDEETKVDKGFWHRFKKWFVWFYELTITIIIKILRYDPSTNKLLPKHIAFIMDGNRRWANKKKIPIKEGHKSGYKKLKQCLNWCVMLGVKTVTVYAFSIDNFKRDKTEVDNIMDLMDGRFKDMFTKRRTFIDKYRVILRVLGDINLFPPHVQESARKAMEYSRQTNEKFGDDVLILNLCCPYTSTFEIENAMSTYIANQVEGKKNTTTCDTNKLEPYFMTNSEPDIVIRTSGETRLSDFLTWQCEKSMIHISSLYWPEFSFWQLVSVVLQYQHYMLQKS